MRQRSFILVAVTVAVLIVGAVAAYAYDSSRDDRIANGVTVAGVDVGDMTVAQAKVKIKHELAGSLQKPITVEFRHRRFKLTAKRAELRADAAGMANDALHQSRDGTIISRVARDITGGEENAQIPAEVHYSNSAVSTFVHNVKKSLDRPAQDATLNFPTLDRVKEHDGITVDEAGLQQRVEQAITLPGVGRTAKPPVRVKHPKVTREQLARKYPTLIVVQRDAFRLTLYKQLKQIHSYSIAVGQHGPRDPGRDLPHPEQGSEPVLARAEQRLGRFTRGQDDPPRTRRPDQGPLARNLRRRRHPWHGRALLPGKRGLARLHPDGDSRRHSAV